MDKRTGQILWIAAAGKTQNHVAEYGDMITTWRRAGIFTQVGYIIGFPHDTVASVRDDLRRGAPVTGESNV